MSVLPNLQEVLLSPTFLEPMIKAPVFRVCTCVRVYVRACVRVCVSVSVCNLVGWFG